MGVMDNSAYPNLRVKTLVPGWDPKIAGKRGRNKTQNMVIILGFETSPNHLFTAPWKLNQPFTKVRHMTFQNVASHFLHCRSPENPDVLTYERVNHNYKEKKRTLAISLIFRIWMFPNGGTPKSSF